MRKKSKGSIRILVGAALIGMTVLVAGISYSLLFSKNEKMKRNLAQFSPDQLLQPHLEKKDIAELLGNRRLTSNHLQLEYFPVAKGKDQYHFHFTLEKALQERIEALYERYDPVYAAFVALDPETGKILAMVDYNNQGGSENLNLKAGYPAASIFKVVTSAAALGEGKMRPRSQFAVNGRFSTLYKSNLRDTVNRWTRYISIEEAFAKSVNTVFGKIAMKRVGPEAMQKYANNFGFNQSMEFDMPLEMGVAHIPRDDEFGLAESGSGYTKRQTLNPIQAAMIAASVINGGHMPAPYLVSSVTTASGASVYEAQQNSSLFQPVEKETARALSAIMEHTITRGTARKEFRDYNHHPLLSKLFIGAKTGSLSGTNPAGKYDWFVGFAQSSSNPKKKIAFASMIVNRKYWRVKSAHIAREAILTHFKGVSANEI